MRNISLTLLLATALCLALASPAHAQWSTTPHSALSVYNAQGDGSVVITSDPVMLANGDFLVMYVVMYDGDHYQNYVQRLTVEGEKLWGPVGVPIVVGGADSTSAGGQLVRDGAGGAILAWWDYRNAGAPGDYELYGQRISADGEWLWDPAGVLLATPRTNLGYMSNNWMCEDGEGGAYVVWAEEGPYWTEDIWAMRFDGNGNVVWPQPLPICLLHGQQDYPKVASREGGGCFIVWTHYTGSWDYLGMQRVTPEGQPMWGTNGLLNQNVSGFYPYNKEILSDGSGGFLYRNNGAVMRFDDRAQVLWNRNLGVIMGGARDFAISPQGRIYVPYTITTSANNQDIFGRCFDLQGNDLWGGRRVLCTAPWDQGFAVLALTDNGFITAFLDGRNHPSTGDIYFQVVDSLGHTFLGLRGRPLYSGMASDVLEGEIISTGQDGVIAFFTQSSYDSLLANRILRDGTLGYYSAPLPAQVITQGPAQVFSNGLIHYELTEPGQITLELFDMLGRRIRILEQRYRTTGSYATNYDHLSLPSGVYLLRLVAGGEAQMGKIAILK